MVVIGWDIAVIPSGPTLIEVNERPDLILLQQVLVIDIDNNLNKRLNALVKK